MSPTVIIGLFLVTSCVVVVSLLALLLPKKIRKIVWILSGIVLIGYYSYYGAIRPYIIQYQTNKSIEVLEQHLEESYTEDSWDITDTDEIAIKPVIYLHVIFESEPRIVYEYAVKDKVINQEDIWTIAGSPIEETDIKPQHAE
jgi:hypothetical protein